jgi:hypothetical protein
VGKWLGNGDGAAFDPKLRVVSDVRPLKVGSKAAMPCGPIALRLQKRAGESTDQLRDTISYCRIADFKLRAMY